VSDLWNYQEILWNLKPRLVIEFGVYSGGSSFYFSKILGLVRPDSKVFSVDVTLSLVPQEIREDPRIEFFECSSADPKVALRIEDLRRTYPGPVFIILDSDHSAPHVYNEMMLLRGVTRPGDYLIVEDSNINGHPVLPDWGPGPFEAMEKYMAQFPNDYAHDEAREKKFGFTFATRGFLIRQ
jgi:cephalosporin hydroxylase